MNTQSRPSIRLKPASITRKCLGVLLILAVSQNVLAQGTVTINGQRTFAIAPETTFSLDGVPISPEQAALLGAGFNTQVTVANVNATASEGDAVNVDLRNLARGPVTSNAPLSVLHQPLVVTAETVLIDIPGNDLANVVPGDLLEVSGFLDANGAMAATRIQWYTNPATDWKLFGMVSALNGSLFSIGLQGVDFAGAVPSGCAPAFGNGQYVEIEALPNAGFGPGSVLAQLTQLECEDPNFDNPPPGTIAASLEGIISDLPDPLPTPAAFSMLGIQVLTTEQTEYRAGTIDDLDLGVRVEVEGFFDDAAQSITALEVRFVQAQVRFEAPVDPAGVTAGESISIMGSTAAFTAQTRDEDGVLSGLSAPTQIEVRALLDRDGQIFASRVRERGQPDLTDTRLRGPANEIDPPHLMIFGITVDTSSAQFRDHNQNAISAAEFFARVFQGTLVSAEDALYDPLSGSMVAGVMELEENTVPSPPAAPSGVASRGISRGTLTQLGRDKIFAHGFD